METKFTSYCIFTPHIGGLGGAQLYVIRRIRHLKKMKCNVSIITGDKSEFMLKDHFEGIDILEVPEISFNTKLFSTKRVDKVIEKIDNFLKSKNVEIIESHSLATSIYAEIISEKVNSKNIVYLLNEDKVKSRYGKGYTGFFDFKLERGELFGVSSKSLEIILSRNIEVSKNKYINIPFDSNEILEDKNEYEDFHVFLPPKTTDFKILTISRLEKVYIKQLISDVTKISIKYPCFKFFLLIIGDSPNKNLLKNLKKMVKNLDNLKIEFSGYLYPVPSQIFKSFNLFIGMGTASVNSISQGCPTIVIDPRDNKSPGFLGIDTNNFAYPEIDIENRTIESMLDMVVKDKNILVKASKNGYALFGEKYENNAVMSFFDQEIINSLAQKRYWSFKIENNLRNFFESLFIYMFNSKKYSNMINKLAFYLNK